jgi:hypothetical protein
LAFAFAAKTFNFERQNQGCQISWYNIPKRGKIYQVCQIFLGTIYLP